MSASKDEKPINPNKSGKKKKKSCSRDENEMSKKSFEDDAYKRGAKHRDVKREEVTLGRMKANPAKKNNEVVKDTHTHAVSTRTGVSARVPCPGRGWRRGGGAGPTTPKKTDSLKIHTDTD